MTNRQFAVVGLTVTVEADDWQEAVTIIETLMDEAPEVYSFTITEGDV